MVVIIFVVTEHSSIFATLLGLVIVFETSSAHHIALHSDLVIICGSFVVIAECLIGVLDLFKLNSGALVWVYVRVVLLG